VQYFLKNRLQSAITLKNAILSQKILKLKKIFFSVRLSFWFTAHTSLFWNDFVTSRKSSDLFPEEIIIRRVSAPLVVKLLGSKGSTDRFLSIVNVLLTSPSIFACKAPLTPLFYIIAWIIFKIIKKVVCRLFRNFVLYVNYAQSILLKLLINEFCASISEIFNCPKSISLTTVTYIYILYCVTHFYKAFWILFFSAENFQTNLITYIFDVEIAFVN